MGIGKRLKSCYESFDSQNLFSVEDAVKIVKTNAKAKFDETIDISESLFNYAVDIWDLYMLEIVSAEDEDGHFNSDSIFYNYLPKLSYDYHSDFYSSYLEIYPDRVDRINQLFE